MEGSCPCPSPCRPPFGPAGIWKEVVPVLLPVALHLALQTEGRESFRRQSLHILGSPPSILHERHNHQELAQRRNSAPSLSTCSVVSASTRHLIESQRVQQSAEMPATATLLGGAMGLCVQLYSNAARRLPLMRHPWEHLLAIGIGSAFGNGLVKWEENLQVELDKSIEDARNANKKRYIGTMRVQQED